MITIIGNGGHAKVLRHMMQGYAGKITIVEQDETPGENDLLVIGVGDLKKRREIWSRFARDRFFNVLDRSAIRPQTILVGLGIQMMAGVIVQPGVEIGDNVILNTGAQVDHDCRIGNHVHIAPGAVLCGGVTVGDGVFIGAGAVVAQNAFVPRETFVKAGSVVA